MITFAVILIIFIGVLSLVGTLYAGKQVDKTIKTVEKAAPEQQEELLKANYYKNSKSNFSIMIIIYVILFFIFAVGFGVYWIYFK